MRIETRWARVVAALALFFGPLLGGSAGAGEPDSPLDLTKVEGIDKFPGGTPEREVLARNGFVVLPSFHRQMFSPYIGGELPHYITCDSAHSTYRVLFEAALKEVEAALTQSVRRIVRGLHAGLAAPSSPSPAFREAQALALGYVAVAARLLGEKAEAPSPLEAGVAAEAQLVEAASGMAESPLFHVKEDYSLYRPRGFYADEPSLAAYFRAVAWLGRLGFRVVDERETRAALVLVRAIDQADDVRSSLASADRVLSAFVGPPDDLTVTEYVEAVRGVTHGDWSDAALDSNFPSLQRKLASLRDPEINAQMLPPEEWRAFRQRTKGLRLLPSRFTPDAWLLQTLGESDPKRALSAGLEVASALGSKSASAHLEKSGEPGRLAAERVRAQAGEVRRRMGGTHYGATLEAAALLFDESSPLLGGGEAREGEPGTPTLPAPLFRSEAWRDRLLATGLSAWASLRHSWMLHTKTTARYMGGTKDPAGVVEPAPRFYRALADLARSLRPLADEVGALRVDPRSVAAELLPVLDKFAQTTSATAEDFDRLEQREDVLDGLPATSGSIWNPASFKPFVGRLRSWLAGTGELGAEEKAWLESAGKATTGGHLAKFVELMEELRAISEHELAGKALTDAEEKVILGYGKTIAALQFFGGNSWLEPRRQMGFVVDVAADPLRGVYLEEAVGAAMEIYVALPLRGGGHRLYVGGVYAYYEFPEATPLQDDAWRDRVAERRVPPMPSWTSSYVGRPDIGEIVAKIAKGEEPKDAENLRDERLGRALLEQVLAARPQDYKGESHLEWLIRQAGSYGEGALRAEIMDAVIARLLEGRSEGEPDGGGMVVTRHGRSTVDTNAAASAVARIAGPGDRTRLVGLLARPPPGSTQYARGWIAQALVRMVPPPSLADVEPLFSAEEPEARGRAVAVLVEPLLGREAEPVAAIVDRVERMLDAERDPRVISTALEALASIAPRMGPEHAARLTVHLGSAEARVRAAAAEAAGQFHDAASAERLLALLKDPDDHVAKAAAKALGLILAASKESGPLAIRAVQEMEALVPGAEWSVQVACLESMGEIGREEGAAALARLASNAALRPLLRSIAIRDLGGIGSVAIPHLFRLTFDETETGSGVNGHQTRMCDDAMEYLDGLLEKPFGWKKLSWSPDEGRMSEILEAVRAEARRRGYVK